MRRLQKKEKAKGKKNMDNRNAIKWLKAISDEQGSSPHKNSRAEREQALHIAIQALEKEEPREPYIYTGADGREQNGCPRCHRENEHNEIIYKGQKYCSVCGQAIGWGEG